MNADKFTKEDFLFIKDKIFQLAGIHLTENKFDLVRSRVQSFFRRSRVKSVDQLKAEIENHDLDILQEFVNLLTTNKTDFFRELNHFNFLVQELVPLWKRMKKKEIKIWSSASSTGEEAYTIAMMLAANLPKEMSFKILATDIDTRVLEKAKNGVYPVSKIAEIPIQYHSFLNRGKNSAEDWFKVSDDIHSKITFKQHNLIENSYPGDEVFDLIFCRNVLIYFERKTIVKLMEKMHRSIKSDGYLFIGHSESINGCQHLFKTVQPAVFTKVAK